MIDTIGGPLDLHSLFGSRAAHFSHAHAAIDELVDVYHGNLPAAFDEFFPEELHRHTINLIRLAWDDLAGMTGKNFPVYVAPDNTSPTAEQRAEKIERIAYGWLAAGRKAGSIGGERLSQILSWWQVGTGDAVMLVLPDFERQTPYFTFRDPRMHLPPMGWTPWSQGRLDGSLFAYQISVGELMLRFPDAANRLRMAYGKNTTSGLTTGWKGQRVPVLSAANGGAIEDRIVWVGEYYSEQYWCVATMEENEVVLSESTEGDRWHPGVCPVVPLTLYSPAAPKGRSLFSDQISIQAAMSRMFSQKLDWYDKTLFPMLFTTPLAEQNIKIGPMAVNIWETLNGQTPNVNQIAPQNPVDADEMMGFTLGMSRMLNRNPEQMQGMGDANSARALAGLKEGVSQTVMTQFWPAHIEGYPKAFAHAAKMDVALWGDIKKRATGKKFNTTFREEYTPNKDLAGYEEDIEIEVGIGLGGQMGVIELLQMLGAGLMSPQTVLEQYPGVRDSKRELERIQVNQMEKLVWADLQTKAQAGTLMPGAFALIIQEIRKGNDLFDVIQDLEVSGRLYQPPAPVEEVPGGGAPGGGDAAALMQALESGGVPGPTGPPSLAALGR